MEKYDIKKNLKVYKIEDRPEIYKNIEIEKNVNENHDIIGESEIDLVELINNQTCILDNVKKLEQYGTQQELQESINDLYETQKELINFVERKEKEKEELTKEEKEKTEEIKNEHNDSDETI